MDMPAPDAKNPSNHFIIKEIPAGEFDRLNYPQTVQTMDVELFKLINMARFWVQENGYPPYKLALQAGISTSQCHRMMAPTWNPSLKLLRKIAISLPPEWVHGFERDANRSLPRVFTAAASTAIDSAVIDTVEKAYKRNDLESAADILERNGLSLRRFDLSDDGSVKVSMLFAPSIAADENDVEIAARDIRPICPMGQQNGAEPETVHLLHRRPIVIGGTHFLTEMDVTQTSNDKEVVQYWKVHTVRKFENPRQCKIFDLFTEDAST